MGYRKQKERPFYYNSVLTKHSKNNRESITTTTQNYPDDLFKEMLKMLNWSKETVKKLY